jgi:hypothetical protein
MVNAEFLKRVPTHQGLPLPRATPPDRAAVPHLSPCAHDQADGDARDHAIQMGSPDEERPGSAGFSLRLSLSVALFDPANYPGEGPRKNVSIIFKGARQ